jgi:hypothetical protein
MNFSAEDVCRGFTLDDEGTSRKLQKRDGAIPLLFSHAHFSYAEEAPLLKIRLAEMADELEAVYITEANMTVGGFAKDFELPSVLAKPEMRPYLDQITTLRAEVARGGSLDSDLQRKAIEAGDMAKKRAEKLGRPWILIDGDLEEIVNRFALRALKQCVPEGRGEWPSIVFRTNLYETDFSWREGAWYSSEFAPYTLAGSTFERHVESRKLFASNPSPATGHSSAQQRLARLRHALPGAAIMSEAGNPQPPAWRLERFLSPAGITRNMQQGTTWGSIAESSLWDTWMKDMKSNPAFAWFNSDVQEKVRRDLDAAKQSSRSFRPVVDVAELPLAVSHQPSFYRNWLHNGLYAKAQGDRRRQFLGILSAEISQIFRMEPSWGLFTEDFKVIDLAGPELRGLADAKMLARLLRSIGTDASATYDVKIGEPHEDFLQVVSRTKMALGSAKFMGAQTFELEVEASLHINEDNKVDYLQIDKWLINGRQFQEWPELDLAGDPAEILENLKQWGSEVRNQRHNSAKEKARAKWFESTRLAMPWRSAQNENSEYYVVDFGSGYTRANLVRLNADGTQASSEKLTSLHGIALQEALPDPVLREKLVKQIADALPTGEILAGGTEGVRYALDKGDITEKDLDAFAKTFREHLGDRAKFDVLTKEQEARAEWTSVEFALRNMDQLREKGVPKSADVAGMVSCGGISCQVAMKSGSKPKDSPDTSFLSFRNLIGVMEAYMDANGLYAEPPKLRTSRTSNAVTMFMPPDPDGPSLERALQNFRQHVRENIVATDAKGLRGVYVLTELWRMLSYKSTEGPELKPYHMYTVSEIRSHLDRWLKKAMANGEPPSQRKGISILMATVGQVVFEEIFHPSAKVCFMGGDDMNWSIGWALEHKLAMASQTK